MWVSFSQLPREDCTWWTHFTEEETGAKREREAEPQPCDVLRALGGGKGLFPGPACQSWCCPFRAGMGEALPGSRACSLPWPGVLGGEEAGRCCAQQQIRRGPAPTAAACLALWPHRQIGLVRAGGLRGEPGSLGSCSKAPLWQDLPWAAAPPEEQTEPSLCATALPLP